LTGIGVVATKLFGSTLCASPGILAEEGGGIHYPTMNELYPKPFVEWGWFAIGRLDLARFIATVVVVLLVVLAARRMKLVPGRGQSTWEMAVGFVQNQIVAVAMPAHMVRKYLPFIATIFFGVLGLNLTGIIPFINVSSNALVAVPLLLALCAWVAFIVRGVQTHGVGHFLADNLFPKGAPKVMYILLAPIELVSTFILRPVTLTIRLMGNMIAGHFLLAVFFVMTSYLVMEAGPALKGVGVVTFLAAFIFTCFEIFVAGLQAFIFSLLTSVYIGLSMEGH